MRTLLAIALQFVLQFIIAAVSWIAAVWTDSLITIIGGQAVVFGLAIAFYWLFGLIINTLWSGRLMMPEPPTVPKS